MVRLFFSCKVEELEESSKKSCFPSFRRIITCFIVCNKKEMRLKRKKVFKESGSEAKVIIPKVEAVQSTVNNIKCKNGTTTP